MSDILIREEQEIARKYLFNDTWIYVFWGIGNFLVWLSLWPLAFMNILPLWIIFIIATLNCCLAYLPSHEAQHGNIVKRSSPYFWVNSFINLGVTKINRNRISTNHFIFFTPQTDGKYGKV